jgi:hypothetical protein
VAWTHFGKDLYERFDNDTNHLGRLKKLKQSDTVEYFIVAFERLAFRTEGMSDVFFSENFLSVASRMRFVLMSSWLGLGFGWTLLKELRKHNRLSVLKIENPPLFLALNQ